MKLHSSTIMSHDDSTGEELTFPTGSGNIETSDSDRASTISYCKSMLKANHRRKSRNVPVCNKLNFIPEEGIEDMMNSTEEIEVETLNEEYLKFITGNIPHPDTLVDDA